MAVRLGVSASGRAHFTKEGDVLTILDGFNRRVRLRYKDVTINVTYRPATARERDEHRRSVKLLNDFYAREEVCRWITKHIVTSDIEQSVNALAAHHPQLFERLYYVIQGLVSDSSGSVWSELEPAYRENLMDGVKLEVLNPKLAQRSCDDCRLLWYSEVTGEPIPDPTTGLPMERVGGVPCESQIGCMKGHYKAPKSLCPENREAVRFHLECKATNHWPDDNIVRANAVIIERSLQGVKSK